MSKNPKKPKRTRKPMSERPNAPILMVVEIAHDATDEELKLGVDQAKQMRLQHPNAIVVSVIDGYNEDPRELHEIPGVRSLCQRFIDLGSLQWLSPDAAPEVLGGFRLWVLATGQMEVEENLMVNAEELFEEFKKELDYQNYRENVEDIGEIEFDFANMTREEQTHWRREFLQLNVPKIQQALQLSKYSHIKRPGVVLSHPSDGEYQDWRKAAGASDGLPVVAILDYTEIPLPPGKITDFFNATPDDKIPVRVDGADGTMTVRLMRDQMMSPALTL